MEMMQAIYPDVPWRSAMQLHDLCQQSKVWVTREKTVLDISDIDDYHARNILKWLDARASIIKLAADAWWMDQAESHEGGELAHDSIEQGCDEVMEMSPRHYLEETPLYKAIKEHVEA
jgi:hypothetical protein